MTWVDPRDHRCLLPGALALTLAACGGSVASGHADGAVSSDATPDAPAAPRCTSSGAVDLLIEIDNSGSMFHNQDLFARSFGAFLSALTEGDPPSAVRSLRVGVISSDLGTAGSVLGGCANSDSGDDGLLNPIRNGLATRRHPPWPIRSGFRPTRCTNDPNQYPSFLAFEAGANAADFRDDLVCTIPFSGAGCGIEQQIEAMYRALVIHDARDLPGNTSPNAGFMRDDAVLALMVLSDEEDGSVRDCRHAEPGVACIDATSVFTPLSPGWATDDLNLRFYLYTPGSAQDPTWTLDRYVDPTRPGRGFLSLKPGRPELVVFGAITGVPIALPQRADGGVDWNALLGRSADGSDGYTGMSPEGPISMRQRNMDPMCSTRVVPACRREGSAYNPMACDANTQYFAWPSRRIAQVVRRFDERYGNGVIGSICRNDYGETLRQFETKIRARICR